MNKAFAPFRLDPVNQCLWRENGRIPLAPKAFSVLEYLVDHAGRLVSQEELLQALWPGTYVQPEVLRKYILEIRRVLDDPAREPAFIETLPRRGYRFIAPVRSESAGQAMAPAAERFPKLVGREAALSEIFGYLDAAMRGHRQVVFVTGEAGIGKTSLVDAFHNRIGQNPELQFARGQCVEGFGGKEAYYPVLEAMGLFLRGPRAEEIAPVLSAQAPTWLIQFPSLIKANERASLLQEILGATRERMVREFCEAIETLAAVHPLILILEDLQWVDDSTLDLISALARRRAPARFLLLATYRPVEVALSRSPLKFLKQDLLIHHLCHELSPGRLTVVEVEEYLHGVFPGSDFVAPLARLVHRHSDGNPLYMVALLDRLRRQQAIVYEGDRWMLTVSSEQMDPGVPETLQQMIEVQFAQLGTQDQRLLRAASVAGHRFSAWAVGAMLGVGAEESGHIEELCEHLAAAQQFTRRAGIQELADGSASAQYEFKHALYREVLYRQLPPVQRGQFHLRLAEHMEALARPAEPAHAAELASHFEAGRDYSRAVRYLIVTAANAARRYAHRDAVGILQHALDLVSSLPADTSREREIEVLERISDVLYAQGEMEQSAEIDYRAADVAAQAGLLTAQVNALTRLARSLAFLAPDRCITVCERAVDVSRGQPDLLLRARAEMLMACWHIVTDGWTQADANICADAREAIHTLSDELPAYYEILYAHVQCTQGDYAGACQTALAGIPRSVENDSLVVYLSAHSSLAHALLHLGRWDELWEVLDRAIDIAGKNGNAPWLGVFRATRAWLYLHAGDGESARREAASLLEAYREEPAGQVRTMAAITWAFTSISAGDCDDAVERFRSVCERPLYPRFFFDWYWRLIGRFGLTAAWLAKGETGHAGREALAAWERALGTADPALRAVAWEMRARVALAEKDYPAAEAHLQKAFTVEGVDRVPVVVRRLYAAAADMHRATGDVRGARDAEARAASIARELVRSLNGAQPRAGGSIPQTARRAARD